jgi:hypothetical protein
MRAGASVGDVPFAPSLCLSQIDALSGALHAEMDSDRARWSKFVAERMHP